MKKAPKTLEYRFHMTEEQWCALKELADQQNITVPEYLRRIIAKELATSVPEHICATLEGAKNDNGT